MGILYTAATGWYHVQNCQRTVGWIVLEISQNIAHSPTANFFSGLTAANRWIPFPCMEIFLDYDFLGSETFSGTWFHTEVSTGEKKVPSCALCTVGMIGKNCCIYHITIKRACWFRISNLMHFWTDEIKIILWGR
jgi:hypothetical protein